MCDQTIGKLGKWLLQLLIQKQNCIILNLGHHRRFFLAMRATSWLLLLLMMCSFVMETRNESSPKLLEFKQEFKVVGSSFANA